MKVENAKINHMRKFYHIKSKSLHKISLYNKTIVQMLHVARQSLRKLAQVTNELANNNVISSIKLQLKNNDEMQRNKVRISNEI